MEKENILLKRYGNTRNLFQVPCSIELKVVQLPRFTSGDFAKELFVKQKSCVLITILPKMKKVLSENSTNLSNNCVVPENAFTSVTFIGNN